MKTQQFTLAAIALAFASMPILTGCGQGPVAPPPPGCSGGQCVGGAPVCLQGVSQQTCLSCIVDIGNMNIPLTINGASYQPANQSVSAGQIPAGTGLSFSVPGGTAGGFGQILLSGGGGGYTAPIATPIGGTGGSVQVQGFDYRYGGIQMQMQSSVACTPPQPGSYGAYSSNCNMYGLPYQAAQMSGSGQLQLNSIALQDIYNVAMQLQYGTNFQGYAPTYGQTNYWPQQPGAYQQPVAPQGAAQVCITAAAFYVAVAAGTSNVVAYGDVFLYVNNSQHGIRMQLQ